MASMRGGKIKLFSVLHCHKTDTHWCDTVVMQLVERYKPEGAERTQLRTAAKRLFAEADRHVFFFPGLGAHQYDPKTVSGYLKGLESIVGGAQAMEEEGIKASCVVYNRLEDDTDLKTHYSDPDGFVSQDAQWFVDYTLKPALSKEASENPFNKTQVPPEELAERAKHITFVSHSYGSIFSREVCNALRKALEKGGYDASEIAQVVQEFVSVDIANMTRLDAQAPTFQRYAFCMTNDSFATSRIVERSTRACEQKGAYACTPEMLLKRCGYEKDASRMRIVPVDEQWQSWKIVTDVPLAMQAPEDATPAALEKLRHYYPNHIAHNDTHDGYSDIIQRVLLNAVGRYIPEEKKTQDDRDIEAKATKHESMLLRHPAVYHKGQMNMYEGSREETNKIVDAKVLRAMKSERQFTRAEEARRAARGAGGGFEIE